MYTHTHTHRSDGCSKRTNSSRRAPRYWPCTVMSLPPTRERISWQSSSPVPAPPLLTFPSAPGAGRRQVFPSSLPPSPKMSIQSPSRQLAKSSLPASLMHVDPHLSCPVVMEPGLRASPGRIHAPKCIELCGSKAGITLFLG